MSDIEAAYRRHYGDLKQLILASKRSFMEKVKLGVDISVQLNQKKRVEPKKKRVEPFACNHNLLKEKLTTATSHRIKIFLTTTFFRKHLQKTL